MTSAMQKIGIKERGNVGSRNRSIGQPLARNVDLDHRFEPVKSARPGSYEFYGPLAFLCFRCDGFHDRIRAERTRPGITRYVDCLGHWLVKLVSDASTPS